MKHDEENRPSAPTPSQVNPVDVVKKSTPLDAVLWLIALGALIAATMTNQYLPGYWAPAANVWVRVAVVIGLIVFALLCLFFSSQGRAFRNLLQDSKIELRRITWPTKQDTVQTTWIVLLITFVTTLIIWMLDTGFNWIGQLILG